MCKCPPFLVVINSMHLGFLICSFHSEGLINEPREDATRQPKTRISMPAIQCYHSEYSTLFNKIQYTSCEYRSVPWNNSQLLMNQYLYLQRSKQTIQPLLPLHAFVIFSSTSASYIHAPLALLAFLHVAVIFNFWTTDMDVSHPLNLGY